MKHIKTINSNSLCDSSINGGCGECQNSCQSACKTSCTVANQKCENVENERIHKSPIKRNTLNI